MLLTIFALTVGTTIGLLRGGNWRGVNAARLRGKGFLITGITATLVLNILSPSQPMFWLIISMVSFVGFAVSNMALSGMIVLLIGISLNVLPVLANGAVPVSELALESVGLVDETGSATIDGPRESTDTAGRLRFLGDVIPVPVFNKVVSIGDLIALVAVADIVMNLILRSRDRSLDDGGVTYVTDVEDFEEATESVPAPVAETVDGAEVRAPSPRKHLRFFVSALPTGKEPAHAAKPEPEAQITTFTDPADLPPPTGLPVTTMPPPAVEVAGKTEREPLEPRPKRDKAPRPEEPDSDPELVVDLTDRRPIIDLTVSPTDEQLAEFLRRRSEADLRLAEQAKIATRSPRHRRVRSRSRRREHGDFADSQG